MLDLTSRHPYASPSHLEGRGQSAAQPRPILTGDEQLYFGNVTSAQRSHAYKVLERTAGLAGRAAEGKVDFFPDFFSQNSSDHPDADAYVRDNGAVRIWFTTKYLRNYRAKGIGYSMHILIHELAHEFGEMNLGPRPGDHAYGDANVRTLAASSPAQAVDNADNYAWYVTKQFRR